MLIELSEQSSKLARYLSFFTLLLYPAQHLTSVLLNYSGPFRACALISSIVGAEFTPLCKGITLLCGEIY